MPARVREPLPEWRLHESESMLVQRGLRIVRGRIALSAGLRARLCALQRPLHGPEPLYLQLGLSAERHRCLLTIVHPDLRDTVREWEMRRAERLHVRLRLREGYRSVRLQAQVRASLPERELYGAERMHLQPRLPVKRERGMRTQLYRAVRDGYLYRAGCLQLLPRIRVTGRFQIRVRGGVREGLRERDVHGARRVHVSRRLQSDRGRHDEPRVRACLRASLRALRPLRGAQHLQLRPRISNDRCDKESSKRKRLIFFF